MLLRGLCAIPRYTDIERCLADAGYRDLCKTVMEKESRDEVLLGDRARENLLAADGFGRNFGESSMDAFAMMSLGMRCLLYRASLKCSSW